MIFFIVIRTLRTLRTLGTLRSLVKHLIYLFLLKDGEYSLAVWREVRVVAKEEVANERFHLYGREHFAYLDGVIACQDECQLMMQGIGVSAVLHLDRLHHLLHYSHRIGLLRWRTHDGERIPAKW